MIFKFSCFENLGYIKHQAKAGEGLRDLRQDLSHDGFRAASWMGSVLFAKVPIHRKIRARACLAGSRVHRLRYRLPGHRIEGGRWLWEILLSGMPRHQPPQPDQPHLRCLREGVRQADEPRWSEVLRKGVHVRVAAHRHRLAGTHPLNAPRHVGTA